MNQYATQLGEGRMGKLIAAYDWTSTSLGSLETWPAALRSVVELILGQRHAICVFWGPDLTLLYNDAYAPILGAKEEGALGQPAAEIWWDVWNDIKPFVDQALSGEGTWSEELPLVMTRNGFPEQTYWTFSYSPLYDGGKIVGMINVASDATPTVVAREREAALHNEMIHRLKNTLAVASAIVSSTLRNASDLNEARTIVIDRINALGRAQDLLHGDAREVSMREMIGVALSAHIDHPGRIDIHGPDLTLAAQQAIGLSLAVYELATNSVKYGALSSDKGKVFVSWNWNDARALRFVWRETGGPPVKAPVRKGFGSRLTNSIVAGYFEGTAATHFHEDGIEYELEGKLKPLAAG
ncbi:sensor histidine kinase [Agrobacterium cavarae]|uniref:sensor histidine kinase n=1 Tax=Agrobacterium cavarae TaxID=2528239 RepID=UPI002FF6E1F2